jgi:hypothetical protein
MNNMKESKRNNTTMDVIGRISTLEGKVSEHDRIFDISSGCSVFRLQCG